MSGEGAEESGSYDKEKLQKKIKDNRNQLYEKGSEKCKGCTETILFGFIFGPIVAHAAHFFYAPDEFIPNLISGCCNCIKKLRGQSQRKSPIDWRGIINKEKWFILMVVLFGIAYAMEGAALTCWFKNAFFGFAEWNRELGTGLDAALTRFGSITLLMMLRMLISNLFPFTSPAFAYLIARCMPDTQGWAGTFYLLVCSMPAGMLVPFLDELAFRLGGKDQAPSEEDKYESHFRATNFLSWITDHLPFSFWVRPWFMEPAFYAVNHGANASEKSAAAAAILAGHFMIWSGPATTMYQRKFVPDWWTCIFIQPLGLLEDVAVVLAVWAGVSPQSQRDAEIALYVFMLVMNGARYYIEHSNLKKLTGLDDNAGRVIPDPLASTNPEEMRPSVSQFFRSKEKRDEMIEALRQATCNQHFIVLFLTLVAIIVRGWVVENNPFIHVTVPTTNITTTTTQSPQPCATEHSNTKVMLLTGAWVSLLAVMFRVIARCLTCNSEYRERKEAQQAFKEAPISNDLTEKLLK